MKIEYGNWTLSLFETEYKEIYIEKNCIKVINPEGKKRKPLPSNLLKSRKMQIRKLNQLESILKRAVPPKRVRT